MRDVRCQLSADQRVLYCSLFRHSYHSFILYTVYIIRITMTLFKFYLYQLNRTWYSHVVSEPTISFWKVSIMVAQPLISGPLWIWGCSSTDHTRITANASRVLGQMFTLPIFSGASHAGAIAEVRPERDEVRRSEPTFLKRGGDTSSSPVLMPPRIPKGLHPWCHQSLVCCRPY